MSFKKQKDGTLTDQTNEKELIRCKDCENFTVNHLCKQFDMHNVGEGGYCNFGKKKN